MLDDEKDSNDSEKKDESETAESRCDAKARDERGRLLPGHNIGFPKGQSGNPGGRAKKNQELVALARQHAPKAIATLARLLSHKDARVQIEAARLILERGYGKAIQPVSVGEENTYGILRIETVVLQPQPGEEPIVAGIDFWETPSGDEEIEKKVQESTERARLFNEARATASKGEPDDEDKG